MKLTREELRKVSFDILCYVDEICKKNNINYYLTFGTLLGAVRHKGFIPWDDDIDICMHREEYNKFVKVMQKQNKYDLIDYKSNDKYYYTFARVSDKKTYLKLYGIPTINNFGVFVDVFPIDTAPPIDKRDEWYSKYCILSNDTFYTVPSKVLYNCSLNKEIYFRIKRIIKRFLVKNKNFKENIENINKLLEEYNSGDSKEKIIMTTPYGLKCIFDDSVFGEGKNVEFEGRMFSAPEKTDEFLKILYGDYMKLPPKEKRKSEHHFVAFWKE